MKTLNIAVTAMKPVIGLIGMQLDEAQTDAEKQATNKLLAQAFQLERDITDAAMKQENYS